MLGKILSEEECQQLTNLVAEARYIVITAHVGPDGDAVGSTACLTLLLRRLGKEVVTIMPNDFPDFLKWVPTAREMIIYEKEKGKAEQLISKADLIFCLDHNGSSRMQDLGAVVMGNACPHVMIDHHLDPDPDWCQLMISHPEMCSACEVLYHVMHQMNWTEGLTRDEATAIYTGMMTDTGAFTFASNRPEVFEIISQLLRTGIDKDRIYRNVFWTCSVDRMRLMGYMLYVKMEIQHPLHASLMKLTNEEFRHYKTHNGDTEGFVNMPLQIEGMRLSIFLREDTEAPNTIRVSTRSVDDFPCNELCARFFNGGGHKNASGGRLHCTMDEAVELAKKAIRAYSDLLK